MQQAPEPTITKHFSGLEDPRRYNKRHQLPDILVIAICAAVCGANSWGMPSCMLMGQAAGTAAVLASREGTSIRDIDTRCLGADLRALGAMLSED